MQTNLVSPENSQETKPKTAAHGYEDMPMKEARPVRRIMQYVWKHSCIMSLALIAMIAGSIAEFAVPSYMGAIINGLSTGNFEEIDNLCF